MKGLSPMRLSPIGFSPTGFSWLPLSRILLPRISLPRTSFALAGLALALTAAETSAAAAPAEPQAASPQSLAPAVTVLRAVMREIVERAPVTGTLVPREEVLVHPEIEGLRLTEVLVEEGDVVARGQVLARLSRDLLETQLAQNAASLTRTEAAIAQARNQIVQAEAAQVEASQALERTRALMRSGNTTEAVLEQRVSAGRSAEGRLAGARDGLRIAEADRAQANAARQEILVRLARTEIKAPAQGIISRKTARIGATAAASGDPLFRIIANGEIELEGEVTEAQLPRLREGAPARISVDPGRTVEGRVRNIYPEVDRATRLGKVRIALPKEPGATAPVVKEGVLRIGSFARGTVEIARRTGVSVPLASVTYGRDGASVLAVAGDTVEVRRVRTGLSADGLIEILDGVAAGETVVARAGGFLRDGDKVRPILTDATRTAESREGAR